MEMDFCGTRMIAYVERQLMSIASTGGRASSTGLVYMCTRGKGLTKSDYQGAEPEHVAANRRLERAYKGGGYTRGSCTVFGVTYGRRTISPRS